MHIALLRHGQAHGNSPTGKDFDRRLTEFGNAQAQLLSTHAPLMELGITSLFVSPWKRTQETATPISSSLNIPITTEPRIGSDQSASSIIDVISDHAHHGPIMIVSHNPIIARAIDLLRHGPTAPHETSMRPGQLMILDINPDDPIGSASLISEFLPAPS